MGQWIELTAADGRTISAWRAEPKDRPRGGLVVVQEIFGVNSHIRSVCDGYAADGYLAVAPALFDRSRPRVERCLRLQLPPARDVVGQVAQVDARLDPVEERRGDRDVALRGVALADAPDVAVDAEDLLHDDQPAARGALRLRSPCRDLRAVGSGQFDPASHDPPGSLSARVRTGER